MESKKDISFGIIPIRKSGEYWEVFLIHQFSRIGNNSYWVFPKGHPEKSEVPKETAERELKEEVGMTAKILLDEPTFTLSYDFVFGGVKINKIVTFFIGVISSGDFKVDGREVKEAGWYSLSDATERLDYQDTKQMFAKAKVFIESYRPTNL